MICVNCDSQFKVIFRCNSCAYLMKEIVNGFFREEYERLNQIETTCPICKKDEWEFISIICCEEIESDFSV